jgi:hypothetical protein
MTADNNAVDEAILNAVHDWIHSGYPCYAPPTECVETETASLARAVLAAIDTKEAAAKALEDAADALAPDEVGRKAQRFLRRRAAAVRQEGQ